MSATNPEPLGEIRRLHADHSEAVMREIARHLSPGNENVRLGYTIAAIRDLAQAKIAEADNYRDLRAVTIELINACALLRIDANRLCDRQLGGTYEDDCRRAIAFVDDILKKAKRCVAE